MVTVRQGMCQTDKIGWRATGPLLRNVYLLYTYFRSMFGIKKGI